MNKQDCDSTGVKLFGICSLFMATVMLSACGEDSVPLNDPQGLDTVEMFTGGQGVEGVVSETLDPRLNPDDIASIDKSLYSHSAAGAIGLVKYETSRQSKAKIREYLKQKGGSYTFDNKGTFGVTTYTSQAVWIPQGSYLAYELKAIFVRNKDGISMLYDYGLRWECRQKENRTYWTIEPCGSTIE